MNSYRFTRDVRGLSYDDLDSELQKLAQDSSNQVKQIAQKLSTSLSRELHSASENPDQKMFMRDITSVDNFLSYLATNKIPGGDGLPMSLISTGTDSSTPPAVDDKDKSKYTFISRFWVNLFSVNEYLKPIMGQASQQPKLKPIYDRLIAGLKEAAAKAELARTDSAAGTDGPPTDASGQLPLGIDKDRKPIFQSQMDAWKKLLEKGGKSAEDIGKIFQGYLAQLKPYNGTTGAASGPSTNLSPEQQKQRDDLGKLMLSKSPITDKDEISPLAMYQFTYALSSYVAQTGKSENNPFSKNDIFITNIAQYNGDMATAFSNWDRFIQNVKAQSARNGTSADTGSFRNTVPYPLSNDPNGGLKTAFSTTENGRTASLQLMQMIQILVQTLNALRKSTQFKDAFPEISEWLSIAQSQYNSLKSYR